MAEEKRLLILARDFPPMGGGGVQRITKFVKYLDADGWHPIVLSAQLPKSLQLLDTSFEDDIPARTKVLRTKIICLPEFLPWRLKHFLTRWILVIDHDIGWFPFAVARGRRLINDEKPGAILSTSSPITAHLSAMRLKTSTGRPWVADFRDPWLDNISNSFPTSLHEAFARRLERQIAMRADAILVVSEPMKTALCGRVRNLPQDHVHVIPNGFDPDDFSRLVPANRRKDRMLIVYNGSLYGSARTARFFLEGAHRALDEGLIPQNALDIRFVGNTGKDLPGLVSDFHLENNVEILGYLPHRQSLIHVITADILLLIIGDGKGSEAVLTGKIFEYMAARKHILCLAGEGAAANLLGKAGGSTIVAPENSGAISAALVNLFQAWKETNDLPIPDEAITNQFDRQVQARRLAAILDQLVP